MQVPATKRRHARFGPFTVDLISRELRNNGRNIHLQEKPFQILAILLDQPGELVTREEFRQKLWPSDTFVDFEHSINTAIKKLREALEDDAEKPRFIETLPRRGYRFIASVAEAPGAEARPVRPIQRQVAARAETSKTRLRRGWYVLLPGAVLVAMAALLVGLNVGGVRDRLLHGKISGQDTIVVADFTNSTGDPVFDDTLKQALSIAFKQSPFLNVLPENKVAATLRRMARPADTVLTHEVIRELCQRAGSKAYIAGSITKLGSEYVLGLKAVNCQNSDLLAQELATASSKEQVLDALGKVAARMRGQLGESLATVRKFDVPLAEGTTSSLEALKAYSLGEKAFRDQGPAAALPHHQRAIQLDPSFASAYWTVGNDNYVLGELGLASDFFTKAFRLRMSAAEPEKLEIAASYYSVVTGQLDKAAQTYQEVIDSYPRRPSAHNNLGAVHALQGKYEKAADAYRHGLDLAPDNFGPYFNLAVSLLALQRFDESRQVIHDAQARKLDSYLLHMTLYAQAFIRADSAAMAEQQRLLLGQPEYANLGLALASDTEAYAGHLDKARGLTKRSVESATKADNKEAGALYWANAGLREVAYGNVTETRQAVARALQLAPASQGVEVEVALAFAMAGDTVRAESLAQDLNKRFPLDTQMQSLWLPAIRAQLALDRKKPTAALADMEGATGPIELGQTVFANNTSCLYPTYIRGQAYLASGQGNAAAAEFRTILDHDGLVWNCWTGALARLGVARANALEARTSRGAEADAARARALAAYKNFLMLWKDADTDIPILKEAKAEYARLQ